MIRQAGDFAFTKKVHGFEVGERYAREGNCCYGTCILNTSIVNKAKSARRRVRNQQKRNKKVNAYQPATTTWRHWTVDDSS
jgi:D-alanyl-D-alanine dipeptidase